MYNGKKIGEKLSLSLSLLSLFCLCFVLGFSSYFDCVLCQHTAMKLDRRQAQVLGNILIFDFNDIVQCSSFDPTSIIVVVVDHKDEDEDDLKKKKSQLKNKKKIAKESENGGKKEAQVAALSQYKS